MHSLRSCVSLAGALLSCALPILPAGAQTTRRVPEDVATIQRAIDASQNNDIVDVAPGRYIGSLDFHGKNVVVRGRAGARSTILDSFRMGSVVTFANGEGPGAVLEGFTVSHGSAWLGGGIHIEGASPTIRACFITDNHGFEGGGVYALNSSAVIEGCFISANWAFHSGGLGGLGAGIYSEGSTLTLDHLTVTQNSADFIGEGLFATTGSPAVTNSIFHTNADIHHTATSQPAVSYCVMDGPWPGTGNLSADPQFVDPGHWNPADLDMHLRCTSPCIGAGAVLAGAAEIDGDPRDATPDIGADEYLDPSHWYTGNAVSFGKLRFNASGVPGDQVFWLVSLDLAAAPLPTAFGDVYLDTSFLITLSMGTTDSCGVMHYDLPMPWVPEFAFCSQVLVGTSPLTFSLPRRSLVGGF